MSEPWKPSVRIWPFADAPEEFRQLSPFEGKEETVIYIPPELAVLFPEDDWVMVMPPSLWFLSDMPRHDGHIQAASEDWGRYSLHPLPGGGWVAITSESEKHAL